MDGSERDPNRNLSTKRWFTKGQKAIICLSTKGHKAIICLSTKRWFIKDTRPEYVSLPMDGSERDPNRNLSTRRWFIKGHNAIISLPMDGSERDPNHNLSTKRWFVK